MLDTITNKEILQIVVRQGELLKKRTLSLSRHTSRLKTLLARIRGREDHLRDSKENLRRKIVRGPAYLSYLNQT